MIDNIRQAPHSTEAEQAIIGGMMIDGGEDRSEMVVATLKPAAFFNRTHRMIYTRLIDLMKRHSPIDLITVAEDLERTGELEQAGGFAYLAELSKNTPSAANIGAYADIVRQRAAERYAIEQLNRSLELLYTPSQLRAEEKLDQVSSIMGGLADYAKAGTKKGLKPFSEVLESWAVELEGRFSPDGKRGLTTGIHALDNLLAPQGMVEGALFVVGARPKMGKTTLYAKMALHCAINENKPALLFSLEMPDNQILEKLVGQQSRVNPNVFYVPADPDNSTYQGDYDGDFSRALATAHRLSETNNLYLDDTPGASLAHIRTEARKIKRARGEVGLIMVDYLTLMTAEKADRNDLAYGMITKGLKNLAKELGCVVVLLTQLNRDLEKRTDKRPMPSDSRDTGQIEQDCDYWLGIYREGKYDENVPPGDTELILRMNRHGETGTVYCRQTNGAIDEVDQQQAQAERDQRNDRNSSKQASKGGW